MFDQSDLIHAYTRAQAIADGVLVDVTQHAKEAGFKVPVALTQAAYFECVAWDDRDELAKPCGQSVSGRLWDVLWMAFQAARKTDGNVAPFSLLRVPREGDSLEATMVDLVLTIHPGDAGEPVCTIMEPGQD